MLDRSLQLLSNQELGEWIDQLVRDRVPENVTLDYKSTILLDSPRARAELANDLASFANEAGGEIVVGVSTTTDIRGEPEVPNGDPPGISPIAELVPRSQDARADLIRPRLIGVEERVVEVAEERVVYIFRVPQSRRGPHMVNGRFYHRSGHRNQRMDEYLVRERYRETLNRESRFTEFLSGADFLSHQTSVESDFNLRVAVLPELAIADAVEFTPTLLQEIQVQRQGHYLPKVTWFGAQDSEAGESWRYYSTGEVVMWVAERVWPVEGGLVRDGQPTMYAPFSAMLRRAAESLWVARLLQSQGRRTTGDMRLLLQWRNPTGNPLVPDLSNHGFMSDAPLVVPQEGLYVRVEVEVSEADLEQPTEVLRQLAQQLGRYFGRTDLGGLVSEAAVDGRPMRNVLVRSPRDRRDYRIWPPTH